MSAASVISRAVRSLHPITAALALLTSGPLTAQDRVVVFPEAGTPVIATEILVAAGPANEPEGEAGVANLAARAVTEPIRPALDSLGAHLSMMTHKDAISFTVIAAPDVWEEAMRILLVALFRDPPSSASVQRERAAIRAELVARATNPADAVAREADLAFFGPQHPWGRPAVGTTRSLERLTLARVDDFLRAHVTADRAVAVVVGPIDPEAARRHLGTFLIGRGRIAMDAPPPRLTRRPVRVDYNSITTWVSASFPLAVDADEEALRLLAYLALDALTTGPNRHLVFNASAEVIPRRVGGEIRLQLVVPPEGAEAWAGRIQAAVQQLARGEMPEDLWNARLRRFRGERLQALASPEERATEAARRLLARSRPEHLIPELEELGQERLAEAARQLGPGTIVLLGPSLD